MDDINIKIKQLIRDKWRVKIRKFIDGGKIITSPIVANRLSKLGDVKSFTATKKYVNIRGSRVRWGTMYSLYCRNVRDGYDKRFSSQNFNDVYSRADNLLKQGENKAVITKDNLPDSIQITKSEDSFLTDKKPSGMVEVRSQSIYSFKFLNIVGITNKLIIAEVAAHDPNNVAWFSVRCTGGTGVANFITNGEELYAIRPGASGSYVLDHELKDENNKKFVNQMTVHDRDRLFEAAKSYAEQINKDLK